MSDEALDRILWGDGAAYPSGGPAGNVCASACTAGETGVVDQRKIASTEETRFDSDAPPPKPIAFSRLSKFRNMGKAALASEAIFLTSSLAKLEITIWMARHIADPHVLRSMSYGLAILLTLLVAPISARLAYRLQSKNPEPMSIGHMVRLMWAVLVTQPISWVAAIVKAEMTINLTMWISNPLYLRLSCYLLAFSLTSVLSPMSAYIAYVVQRDGVGLRRWLRDRKQQR